MSEKKPRKFPKCEWSVLADCEENAVGEHKQQRIAELGRWGLMDSEQAEERFMEIEHANVSASLKRIHGISAA
jgi:hypothetical protein